MKDGVREQGTGGCQHVGHWRKIYVNCASPNKPRDEAMAKWILYIRTYTSSIQGVRGCFVTVVS